MRRIVTWLTAAAVGCAAAVTASPAVAVPFDREIGTAVAGPAQTVAAASTTTTIQPQAVPAWLSRLNHYRSQFGAPAVTESSTLTSGAAAHANYMAVNGVVTHTETPGTPGYTVAGAAAGPNSNIAAGWTTQTEFIDAWAASPFDMINMLHTSMATTGYGQATSTRGTAAALNVLSGRTRAQATTGWPRVWPRGTTTILEMSDGSSPDPVAGCPAPVGAWYGTATIVDFGPGKTVTSASAVLYEDGVRVPTCVRVAGNYANSTASTLMAGKALVIPLRPLVKNKGYYGTVTTSAGTASLKFDTGNPASGVFGDHNGDRRADVLSVRTTGELYFYQSAAGPALRAGLQVGRGWEGMNWFATVPDLNGDGRTELVARRDDGTLWLYGGAGRGTWMSGVQVGRGWSGLDQMTVLRDITGDGKPDLVARTATGELLRYSFTSLSQGLSGRSGIGTGWQGMRMLTSPHDITGDGKTDLVAVHSSGLMYAYRFSGGRFSSPVVVGQGWDGMVNVWSPGDMDLDGRQDLLARRSDGTLWFYSNGGNRWVAGRQIGSGWQTMRLLS